MITNPSLAQREAAVEAYILCAAADNAFWLAAEQAATADEMNALQNAREALWQAFEGLGVDLVVSGGMPVRDEKNGVPVVSSDELEDCDGWRLKMEVA